MIARRRLSTLAGALALAASLPLAFVGAASAQDVTPPTAANYQIQDVASPNDPTFTQLLGINNHRAIAGYFGSGQVVNGTLHPNKGFTLKLPNTFTPENYPNSVQTQVIGINNRGDTDGFYIDQAGNTHGFMDVDGNFTTVDLPGTTFNQLLGLNNHGQEAGYFQDAAGQFHAYVREADGSFLVLPIANSQATGINDADEVVGFTQPTSTTASGFILRHGRLTMLNVPGSTFTQALGVDNDGVVVGQYNDAAGATHGFIYRGGEYKTVDAPGATATTVNGINDEGDIVGFFVDAQGNTVGLVGEPRR